MGIVLGILFVAGGVVLHLLTRGTTFRPVRFRQADGVGILTLAASTFQTPGNRRRLLRKLDRVVCQGWRDLVLDLSEVEACGRRGSIQPLRTFLDDKDRPEALHMVLVSRDPEVRASYRLGPLPKDVPMVRTVEEGLDYLKEQDERVAPV